MTIKLDLIRSKEVLATAGGLVAGALIYAILIQPSIQLTSEYTQALEAKNQAEEELANLHNEYQKLQQDIQVNKHQLGALGGSPPPASQKDVQIARVTTLANNCELKVDQYSPVDTWDKVDHQELFLRFAGRGKFQAIQKFLQRLEAEIDFVDVTHFSIALVVLDGPTICTFNWACRINGMTKPEPIKENKSKAAVVSSGTQKVVLSEP